MLSSLIYSNDRYAYENKTIILKTKKTGKRFVLRIPRENSFETFIFSCRIFGA